MVGSSWTTDAPFRETSAAIERARADGVLAVEMESASLYAFSTATGNPVACVAYITNQLAVREGDFHKGDAGGSLAALGMIQVLAEAFEEKEQQTSR